MSDVNPNAPQAPYALDKARLLEWLAYDADTLIKRRGEIMKSLAEMAEQYATVPNDEAQGELAECRRMAEALVRSFEDKRKEQKTPFWDAGKDVDAWFASQSTMITKAIEPLKKAMDAFAVKKAAAERERLRLAAIAAEEERKRQEAAALAALQTDDVEQQVVALDTAAHAEQAAEKAIARAEAPTADMSRTRGTFGAVSSIRETISVEVIDRTQVDIAFMQPNLDAIRARAMEIWNASPRNKDQIRGGAQPIAGVRITVNQTTQVR